MVTKKHQSQSLSFLTNGNTCCSTSVQTGHDINLTVTFAYCVTGSSDSSKKRRFTSKVLRLLSTVSHTRILNLSVLSRPTNASFKHSAPMNVLDINSQHVNLDLGYPADLISPMVQFRDRKFSSAN